MKYLNYIWLSLFSLNAVCQDLPLRIQEQLENYTAAKEDQLQDDDQLLQQLEYFQSHPLNLNMASTEDLSQFPFLTDLQISHFIKYRALLGKLLSIYELQAIPSWDLSTIRKLLPYIFVGSAFTFRQNFFSRFKGQHGFLFRITRTLEKARGYQIDSGNYYLGDPNHLLFRYRYQFKDLMYYGLSADKDAGEQFFRGAQSKGFDFYSFHFFIRKLGIIKSLAIGDYTVNLGQGLIQWHATGFGKSAEAITIKRQSPILMPYRAAGEYYFNRGAGITLSMGKMEATFFGSRKKLSGNSSEDSTDSFSSFNTSGYHRTASEMADRNRIIEFLAGGNVSYKTVSFHMALNASYYHFNIPIQKREEPYQIFTLTGSRAFYISFDHGYTFKNSHFFGEVAFDKNKSPAIVQGMIMSVDPKLDLGFIYRNISSAYQSIYGNAFTESGSPSNEKGFFAGLNVRPMFGWTMNAYADVYKFPWLRYRVNAPSAGTDYLIQVIFQPVKHTELFARYRNEAKQLNTPAGATIRFPQTQRRQSLRIHYASQLHSAFLFRSRIEIIWYELYKKREEGFLWYVETVWRTSRKIKLNARFQYVETASFDTRIYAYESDVLYSFSIPAFYNKGLRYYATLNYEYNKNLSCWIRVAQMLGRNKEGFGSGLGFIEGQRATEIKFQLLFTL